MSKRDWIEVSTSLVGGAGIGAALMYLFDPDHGDQRRAQARETAGDALSSTGETLGSAWQTIAEKARDAGQSVAEYTQRLAERASSTASDYADDASSSARSMGRGFMKSGRRAMKTARGWVGQDQGMSAGTAVGITGGALCALAMGAGLMFFLDPAQGRRRRALVRDKTYSAAKGTAEYAEKKGRHWSNKARGMAADASSMASNVTGKVKDKLGMGGSTSGQTGGGEASAG
jgi:gas vesicle protein